jgi:hypothetical protein
VRTTATAAGIAAGVLLASTPAAANGRFPASNQIVFSPANPSVIMARTSFALLPSTDNGATWSYLCEGVLGLPATTYEDPELGFTANGALVAGMSAPTLGLDVSNDLGCSWECKQGPVANQQIVDTVVRPDQPHHILALTGTYGIVDGGSYSQVFESADDGATWTALGVPLDPVAIVTTIDVAKSDPMRIYVSATRGFGPSRTASLFVSTNAGATWTERTVTGFLGDQTGGEASVFIGAVDPTNADRVYLRSNASAYGGESRLYATSNAGMTFTIAKDFQVEAAGLALVGELLGFALSPDGSQIYVGTKESGLWRANSSDMSFSSVNPNVGIQCLATRQTATGTELWACGNEYKGAPGNPGNFIIGRSTDQGATFEALLPTLTSLHGIAQCGSSADAGAACGATGNAASVCTCDEYTNWCQTTEVVNACLGCGMGAGSGGDAGGGNGGGADAGVADAGGGGSGGGTGGGKGSSSSCGFAVEHGGGAAGLLAALAISLAGLARRRRR